MTEAVPHDVQTAGPPVVIASPFGVIANMAITNSAIAIESFICKSFFSYLLLTSIRGTGLGMSERPMAMFHECLNIWS